MDLKSDIVYNEFVKFVKECSDIEELRCFTLVLLVERQIPISLKSASKDILDLDPRKITKEYVKERFKKAAYDFIKPLM